MSLSTLRSPPRLPTAEAHQSPRRSPRNHQPAADALEVQVYVARTLEDLLADRSLYMEREQYFELIQDEGTEMSEIEELSYSSRLAKPKKKTKNIAYGNRFYPLLYTLAAHLWEVMDSHRLDFPNIPKGGSNKSTYIHDIGKEIAQEREERARADIHSIGDDGDEETCFDLMLASDKQKVFVLKQSALLSRMRNRYGPLPESKKTTIDDKVRVMGVLFMSERLRDYLPDMLGKTRGGNRASIDASSARKRTGFRGLWMDFVDMEKIVVLPEEWTSADTQLTVDEHKEDGMYEQFGQFDPNNKNRIALAWTEKEVAAIFQSVISEYNPAMHNWMKGTGGGSGAPEDFSVWERRDPITFIDYSNQAARMYLSVVYIWDRKYHFLLVTQKDSVPDDLVIDDEVLFGSGQDDDEDEFGEEDGNGRRSGGSGGSGGRGGRRSASTRKDDNIVAVLRAMNSHREEANLTTAELLATIRGGSSPPPRVSSTGASQEIDVVHQAMTKLKETSEYLEATKQKLNDLMKKRKTLASNDCSSKKMKSIEGDICETKAEVKVLRAAKAKHLLTMKTLCKSSDSDEDGSSSDEEYDE